MLRCHFVETLSGTRRSRDFLQLRSLYPALTSLWRGSLGTHFPTLACPCGHSLLFSAKTAMRLSRIPLLSLVMQYPPFLKGGRTALPEFPDNPCRYVSGSQTPAVFGCYTSQLRSLPVAFGTMKRLGVHSVANGATSAIIQISGLNSTPASSFHAATITLGYPYASALHYQMG